MDQPNDAKRSERVAKIIWAAFVMSTILYAVILYMQTQGSGIEKTFVEDPVDVSKTASIVLGLQGMAIVGFLLGFIVPPLLAKNAKQNPSAWFVHFILRCVLFDVPALAGFAAGFLTRSFKTGLFMMILAGFGLLISFPTESALRRLGKP